MQPTCQSLEAFTNHPLMDNLVPSTPPATARRFVLPALALIFLLLLSAVALLWLTRTPDASSGPDGRTAMLPAERLAGQQAGGTYTELFPPTALQNQSNLVAGLLWYASLSLLGWLVYPLVRLALPGLADRGFPLARTAGLLLLAYPAWLAGSLGVPVTRVTIAVVLGGLGLLGILAGVLQRVDLRAEWRARKGQILTVEMVCLVFFLIDLGIRLGNPDLWHPHKGGEKPMDFAYLNAIIKSTTFPPFDPWLAGGYINYYYYGFVVVGTLIKLLAIQPVVAYNLMLPTLFSLLALAGYSAVTNLLALRRPETSPEADLDVPVAQPLWPGLVGAAALVLASNWGAVRMIWYGLQSLAQPGAEGMPASLLTRLGWFLQGIPLVLGGTPLPYPIWDWYWIPSRAIRPEAGNEITEFPFFTFLYGDPHAHMIALPIAGLALAWAISTALRPKAWGSWANWIAGLLLGALTLGALRPTNTWDFPTYLALGVSALAFARWREYRDPSETRSLRAGIWQGVLLLVEVAALAGLAILLYQPYSQWYLQGYNQVQPWEGNRTPIGSYITHWGPFLLPVVAWLVYETIQWMAATPLSALNNLRQRQGVVLAVAAVLLIVLAAILLLGVSIAWLALPIATWAAVLLLRPGQSPARQVVLFLIGTAMAITLFVELFVLAGDIGRMNTVFKLYLQAWLLLGVSAVAAVAWMWPHRERWHPTAQGLWTAGLSIVLIGSALTTLLAMRGKIEDRMAPLAPHTLNGMAFMDYATYGGFPENAQQPVEMDLSEDARAIRWLQQNIGGSPVIVEASLSQYYWGSRYSIYTGLPTVMGWHWHQQQQRTTQGDEIFRRILEVESFYSSPDPQAAYNFLRRYGVSYIVVGQLERAMYASGMEKFATYDGVLWNQIYTDGQTTIYAVTP